MLIQGKWTSNWHPVQAKDKTGRFIRQTSEFRNWITPDGSPGPTGNGGFKAETGRYRLYVALICPWASRTLIARSIKGLERHISVTVVEPFLTHEGWKFGDFPESDRDPLFNARYIHELYTRAAKHYTGRATVPVLWDMKQNVMVNNESADILRMFNSAFRDLTPATFNLYPTQLAEEIDEMAHWLYNSLNNGVYKAGFASSQIAYNEAVKDVFLALDKLEIRLSDGRPFLMGTHLTEADIRLFVTLIRFDVAYHGLFKTNLKRIADYPAIQTYMEQLLNIPEIAKTVNLDHIKAGYYSIKALNPSGIIPKGPLEIEQLVKAAKKNAA